MGTEIVPTNQRSLNRIPRRLLIMFMLCSILASCSPIADVGQRRIDGDNLSLKWTYHSGAAINQVPLRIGDVLIVVPAGGPMLALEVESGELRWSYDPPEIIWERSYASDGRQVFVGIQGGQLVALEADSGEVVWVQDLGIEVQVPPLVVGSDLYVPTTFVGPGIENQHQRQAKLFVLDTDSGTVKWSFETENYILQTPELYGETLYLAGNFLGEERIEQGGHTRIYALNVPDGTVRWTYESEDGFPKRLYATDSAVAFIGYQDFVSGVDVKDGTLRWRRDTGNWVPSLSGRGESIYFGSANTIVHALNIANGEILWQHNIEGGTFNFVLGAPILIEDELIFLTQHGYILSLRVGDGELLWEYPTGITSRVGLLVSGGWIFIGDENGIISAYSDS